MPVCDSFNCNKGEPRPDPDGGDGSGSGDGSGQTPEQPDNSDIISAIDGMKLDNNCFMPQQPAKLSTAERSESRASYLDISIWAHPLVRIMLVMLNEKLQIESTLAQVLSSTLYWLSH